MTYQEWKEGKTKINYTENFDTSAYPDIDMTKESKETIKKTKVGDVISYTLTIGKRIRTFKIRASLNADEYSYQAINPRSAFSYGMTKIYRVEGADVIVGDGTGDETSIAATAIDTSACKEIVAFDKNTKEVYSAGVADIKPGMSAYVKASYGKPIGIWFVIE